MILLIKSSGSVIIFIYIMMQGIYYRRRQPFAVWHLAIAMQCFSGHVGVPAFWAVCCICMLSEMDLPLRSGRLRGPSPPSPLTRPLTLTSHDKLTPCFILPYLFVQAAETEARGDT